jgi:xylulokinase
LLEATGLSEQHMPALVEGTEPAGLLRTDIADAWGLPRGCVVAGGGGDNAAGAVGLGCVAPGDAFVSLGTSGVIFLVDSGFRPAPEQAVHAFCHCVPDAWHRMAVILSAAACLSWLARLTGAPDEAVLLQEAEADASSAPAPIFLPYLSGERTPHNDATACGVFFGLTAGTERPALTRAVLEGVAFALADGLDALTAATGPVETLSVIGGGARSAFWGRILATALNCRLAYRAGGEVGPALGAARLGRIAAGDGTIAEICTAPPVLRVQEPDAALMPGMMARREAFRRLYPALKDEFRHRI